jgi:hypothetical protein
MNEQFRSFSVLEEEKRDSTQKINKTTKVSDQELILTVNNEEKVEI